MKKEQSELLDYFINPSFLEQIKQPIGSVVIRSWCSFNMVRNGIEYDVTLYSGEAGQVNISKISEGDITGRVIISDYCKNIEEFKGVIEKLDDMALRFPTIK